MSIDAVTLDVDELRRRLVQPHGPYARLDAVAETTSTNSDLTVAVAEGAPDRRVLLAEYQSGGRGRRQRGWASPPGLGLQLSTTLRPGVPHVRLSWVSLLAGLALVRSVRELTTLDATLKWPNDLLVDVAGMPCKAAGILSEAVAGAERLAVVLGVGVNVLHTPADLPPPAHSGIAPTSLAAAGAAVSREELAAAFLHRFAELDDQWRAHDGDARAGGLLDSYSAECATLGHQVRVEFSTGQPMLGTATGVDDDGRLLVRDAAGEDRPVSAGDVVHLRPVPDS